MVLDKQRGIKDYDFLTVFRTRHLTGEVPDMGPGKTSKSQKSASAKKPILSLPKAGKHDKKAGSKKVTKKKTKVMVEAPKSIKRPGQGGSIDVEGVRRTLLGMREKLLSGISEKSVPEALTTRTDTGDVVDQAGGERERELSLLFSGRDREKLRAIDQALEKLKEGTYGVCEECGEKIGLGRIKAMPLARFCVSCQAMVEKEMSLQRKSEEDLSYEELPDSKSEEEES